MKRIAIITTIVATITAMTTLSALAAHRPADADQEDVVVEWSYDEEMQLLTWWLAAPEGEDPVVCPEEDVADDECHVVEIVAHGDGEPNHGAFVSAFVHSLKELDLDVPRGWLVRQVARSELGKGDVEMVEPVTETEDVDDVEPVTEVEAEHGRPDHAGKPEHAGPPDHAGPPAHAKGEANGRGGDS